MSQSKVAITAACLGLEIWYCEVVTMTSRHQLIKDLRCRAIGRLEAGQKRIILDVYVHRYSGATGDAIVLQGDNARPHRARILDAYLKKETIQHIQRAVRSLDLNLSRMFGTL
ncbi:hypothetical protein TNCV_1665711 [Trichonephila clavipes]|nr:hypothetical protein TNCV_1665711 [Trichonephila clavipes]